MRRPLSSRTPTARAPLGSVAVAVVLAVAALLGGCTRSGGGAAAPPVSADPAATLAAARKALDEAQSLHFTMTSDRSSAPSTALLGGQGDLARPDKFSGALDVVTAGLKANVKVVSVGGTVYVQLLGSRWSTVKPESIGLHDPGQLMAKQGGLTDLLTAATSPTFAGEKRRGAEVLRQIRATVPGATVAALLSDLDPAQPVQAVFGVDQATGQLREATLTGPFLDKTTSATYTVVLEKYGQQVDIRAPVG